MTDQHEIANMAAEVTEMDNEVYYYTGTEGGELKAFSDYEKASDTFWDEYRFGDNPLTAFSRYSHLSNLLEGVVTAHKLFMQAIE